MEIHKGILKQKKIYHKYTQTKCTDNVYSKYFPSFCVKSLSCDCIVIETEKKRQRNSSNIDLNVILQQLADMTSNTERYFVKYNVLCAMLLIL